MFGKKDPWVMQIICIIDGHFQGPLTKAYLMDRARIPIFHYIMTVNAE